MSDAKKAWGLLAESVGEYSGRGVNHEKQNFTGNLNHDQVQECIKKFRLEFA